MTMNMDGTMNAEGANAKRLRPTPGPYSHNHNAVGKSYRLIGAEGYGAMAEVFTEANARMIAQGLNERDALRASVAALKASNAELVKALEELTLRCDGAEGVRADGSNIQTIAPNESQRRDGIGQATQASESPVSAATPADSVSKERWLVHSHGGEGPVAWTFCDTMGEVRTAIAMLVWGDPKDADEDELRGYVESLADTDNWHGEGIDKGVATFWSQPFEIDGISVMRLDPRAMLAALPSLPADKGERG